MVTATNTPHKQINIKYLDEHFVVLNHHSNKYIYSTYISQRLQSAIEI